MRLPITIQSLLHTIQRDHVASLHAEANRVGAMSPESYMSFAGLRDRPDTRASIVLAMRGRGWTWLEYDPNKPGWRSHGEGWERYESDDSVAEFFDDIVREETR